MLLMAKYKSVIFGNLRRLVKGKIIKKLPLIAGHKLLYSCNLRCRMCPFWRRKDETLLSLEDEVKIMKSLEKAGVIFMGFEGGEPLLRRDLPHILEESYKRFHTSLVTNGWLLKDRIKEIHEHLDHLFVSLDGIGEVHDKIRGVVGSYERAIEGIKITKKFLPVSISFTITKENMNQVEDIVYLAKKLDVSVNFQVAYDYSTAERMSPKLDELKSTLQRLLELKNKGYPIVNSREYFNALIKSWFYGIPWKCRPWLTINIDPLGRIVLPCYVLNEYNGKIKAWEIDIVKLWNSYNWENYINCNKCALSCYLEPSLLSITNSTTVKDHIINSIYMEFKNFINTFI
jgi:radical SAM family uncharacterized protein